MLFKLKIFLSGFFIIIFTNNSIAFETVAKSAIILDTNSKLVLMQKMLILHYLQPQCPN